MNMDKGEGQLQIHLITKQQQFAVPDIPYSLPASVTIQNLNTLLNTLLKENEVTNTDFEFDFLIRGEFLKTSAVGKHLKEREISFEDIIEIEYVERYPAPEPQDCLIHDDWVSAIKTNDKYILTGCYDNFINIWSLKGEHKLTVAGHEAPIKGVTWIKMNDDTAMFASASKDQTLRIWEWDHKNKAECLFVCKGHERAIDCLDVSPDSSKLASGSWDNLLKIWSALPYSNDGESSQKRPRSEAPASRTPTMTLEGHREAISAVQWIDNSTILTSSWDHTIKFWDLNMNGITKEIPGNKSFFDAHYSPLNGLIIAASADKNLKLYDPRATQGSVVKSSYLGHTQWVQSVRWSKTEEFLFISGAYDNHVKLWDYRSPKAPLFDLMGHEDKVLAVDWTNPKYMVSGGSDNSLRIFKSKKVVEE